MDPNNADDDPSIPRFFTSSPPIQDSLETESSLLQEDTINECLPFLSGSVGSLFDYNEHGLPSFARAKHSQFLHNSLKTLPAGFVAYDAARPWIMYWALAGLTILGEDIKQYQERQVPQDSKDTSKAFGHLLILIIIAQDCSDTLFYAKYRRRVW